MEGGRAKPQPASKEATASAPRRGRFVQPSYKPPPVKAQSAEHVEIQSWRPGSGEVVPIPAGSYLDPEEQLEPLEPPE